MATVLSRVSGVVCRIVGAAYIGRVTLLGFRSSLRSPMGIVCCVSLLVCTGLSRPSTAVPTPAFLQTKASASEPILLPAMDGFNLDLAGQPAPDRVDVKLLSEARNWFAGTFLNLPTGKELTISLSLGDLADLKSGDARRWFGLRPMLTYADPTRYESYEWFRKDEQGRWVSGDPLKRGAARFAGTGKLPDQKAVPPSVAAEFLSIDGDTWCPWREMACATVDEEANAVQMRQAFALPKATIAMRVPYTYTYLQAFLSRLQAARLPGVFVDTIGKTPARRKLQVVRLEDEGCKAPLADRRTVLVIAREHATEAASSWVLHGMLAYLLEATPAARQARANTTWLFVPIEDPDGSVVCTHNALTDGFKNPYDPDTPDEVFQYARHFRDYVDAGHAIDLAIALHNVEVGEVENLLSPLVSVRAEPYARAFNRGLFGLVGQHGFQLPHPDRPSPPGGLLHRLYGWCGVQFGALDAVYEVNDRYPANRLALDRLQRLGRLMAVYAGEWCFSGTGREWHGRVLAALAERDRQRKAYFAARQGRDPPGCWRYHLLIKGY